MRVRILSVRVVATVAVSLFVFGLWASPAWAAPELHVNKTDSPDPVTEGEVLTYTIVVENRAEHQDPAVPADTATDVRLSDPLPAGTEFVSINEPAGASCNTPDPGDPGIVTCDLGDLKPGDGATVILRVRPTGVAPGSPITNTATATSQDDPTVTDEDSATTRVAPDLEITKLDDPDPVSTEDLLLYTLRVQNQGDNPVTDISVIDDLPLSRVDFVSVESNRFDCEFTGGLVRCTGGTLAPDEVAKVEIVVEPEEAGTIQNTAVVRFEGDRIDADTESTEVEDRNANPNPPPDDPADPVDPVDSADPADPVDPVAPAADAEDTTAETANPETTNAEDAQQADAAAEINCVEILRVFRASGASDAQYEQYRESESFDLFSADQLQECLAREVIDDPDGLLADTGGVPLLPIAALVLAGAGIFVGRSVLGSSRRD